MKYTRQIQGRLERLNKALLNLNKLIRAGKQQEAIEYMETGPLKESYENLESIIQAASSENYGARGVQNTGTL